MHFFRWFFAISRCDNVSFYCFHFRCGVTSIRRWRQWEWMESRVSASLFGLQNTLTSTPKILMLNSRKMSQKKKKNRFFFFGFETHHDVVWHTGCARHIHSANNEYVRISWCFVSFYRSQWTGAKLHNIRGIVYRSRWSLAHGCCARELNCLTHHQFASFFFYRVWYEFRTVTELIGDNTQSTIWCAIHGHFL